MYLQKRIVLAFFCLCLAILCLGQVVHAVNFRPLTTQQKLEDFRGLVQQLKSGYGPLEYKKNEMGLDLDVIALAYENKIKQTNTNSDYYYTVVRFVAEFRDGHFNASVPTTHRSELAFGTELVQGKVLIDWIDRKVLPEDKFPFQRGDEIVLFDGKPVADVVKNIMTYVSSGTELSVQHMATWALTFRRGSRMPVPRGEVKTTSIRHANSQRVETVASGLLKWKESGKPLDEFTPPLAMANNILGRDIVSRGKLSRVNYDLISVHNTYRDIMGERRFERSYACNPGTRIAIPENATIIMMEPFVAYYHFDERFAGNVGYLRIPDYFPMNDREEPEYEARFAQYEYAVKELETNTVGLVIDQDHNCGGSVEYLERILGLFMTSNYSPMQFELLASKESYFDFESWMKEVPEFTVSRSNLNKVLSLIGTAAEAGQSHLTSKTSINGIIAYQPNAIHYTKPIVVLIDEIAGSGGDAFPAMMGHARAKLVGTHTSGLGGHVQETTPLNYSRIGGRLTKSLFYRPDGVAVENNGAEPAAEDQYSITYADFVDGYRNYREFYLTKLLGMMKR